MTHPAPPVDPATLQTVVAPAKRKSRRKPRAAPPIELEALEEVMAETFGFTELRPGQQEVIESVLQRRDTLAIMPTGSGKSLCYQLPALKMPGMTVVVSPLIALMKDQVDKLQEAGVRAADFNSTLTEREANDVLTLIAQAKNDFIFTTPEKLAAPEFIATLRQTRIDLFVIDEAHCISQWGHDFRPAFLQLANAIENLGDPLVLALTATATDNVIADIKHQLRRPNMHVINTGIFRPNLHYSVRAITDEEDKISAAVALARSLPGSGIIYAATIKAAEEIHRALCDAGEPAACYHGQLKTSDREAQQDAFMSGACRIMVATNAFGMGIDKPDIRFVIHHHMPANLEAYYQESGRAGRDGKPAECILLYTLSDKRLQQFFLSRRHPVAADLEEIYENLRDLISEEGKVSLSDIRAALPDISANKLLVALRQLQDSNLIGQDAEMDFFVTNEPPTPEIFTRVEESYREKNERDQEALERMVFYAQTGYCRWKVLLDHFGEPGGDHGCGICDNCLHPPEETLTDLSATLPPANNTQESTPAPLAQGCTVSVPKFGKGKVVSVEADKVTILFPDAQTKTFLRDFVKMV